MKKDIILCGVGGQGILSIATIIGQAATQAGIYPKQAEPIWSDLIPMASADVIISMEPMESLRYLEYLSPEGTVVTGSVPFVNIPNYPDETALQSELDALPHVVKNDIEAVAKDCNGARGANMVLLGMAAPHIGILSVEQLREAIKVVFARKGEAVVEANLRCFDSPTHVS